MSVDMFAGIATGSAEGFVPAGHNDDPDDAAATQGGGPQCEVCGVEVPWSGRGRKPKRCQDHKTRGRGEQAESAGRSTGGGGVRAAAAEKRFNARCDAIVGDLEQGCGELAGTLSPVAPVTAATIMLGGHDASVALVRIAARYPRMLDGLEAAATVVPFVSVGKFVAAIMLAVMVDMGRMTPEGIAAEYLGVAHAAAEVGWKPAEEVAAETAAAAAVDRNVVAPPRFKM